MILPYKCKECGFDCAAEKVMKQHMETHEEEKKQKELMKDAQAKRNAVEVGKKIVPGMDQRRGLYQGKVFKK